MGLLQKNSRNARMQLVLVVILSSLVLAFALRFWFEIFIASRQIHFPQFTVNWTPFYCWCGGVISSCLSHRVLRHDSHLNPTVKLFLQFMNFAGFLSLLSLAFFMLYNALQHPM